ncbi:hypothetical protein Pla175_49630 [Pirellulimonas nuda]|uniref:Uncharacterized protein n=1 Tax=Pirellulimonas nuda TaxID=2528009 RepID=A0A518DJ70_9BACT|nr:DUF3239 domain-containing protein [Pirellulimonas nuda]QDU91534.1 hypothetical protein Pla175_49630 [Pirellulimonas nuda]
MPDENAKPRVRVKCPHCGAAASAPAEYVGRRVKCGAAACRQSFELAPVAPAEEPAPPAAPPSAPPGPASVGWPGVPDSLASNPGKVPFNPLRWYRHQPLGLIVGGGVAALALALWLGLSLAGMKASIPTKDGGETPIWLFAPASLATMAFYAWLAARKFNSGDANPGVVVSLSPALLAVPTDLTQGGGSYPVVKIVPIKLKASGGQPLQLGTRVATVATYAMPPNKHAGHWSDFYPYPAEYATGDPQALQRLLASFTQTQYEFLQQALTRIERPFKPGLYAMWETPDKPAGRRISKAADF